MIRTCDITTAHRGLSASRVGSIILVLTAGCVGNPMAARTALAAPTDEKAASNPFVDPATLDPNVPSPASVVGHAMGNGAIRYEPLVRYLHTLAVASPFVVLTPYAESHEGRTLYFLTITSEANHARLDRIKRDNARLADPRLLSDDSQARRIVESLPAVAWLAYSIHGDELSSTDAAVQLAYQLAAGTDEPTRRLREELVIHIDPLMNPDGRERYLTQLQQLNGKVPNPDYQAMQHSGLWSAGRGNHYLFDLNRDWLMQVHPETRGRAAKNLEWNPHLVVDSHEMGPLDTYLFDPPREPVNNHTSEKVLNWRRRFSAEQARAFDAHGWSYYTQEWYEEWYPGYTNSWSALQGAIGLLYEQAGVDAGLVKQAAGNTLSYREAVHHQLVSSLANLETLRANRRGILADYLAERRWAVSPERSGGEVLLVSPSDDHALQSRFADLLGRHGLEFEFAARAVRARQVVDVWGTTTDIKVLPAGTLIVRAAQPRRRLLRALLEFDPHMTDGFVRDEREDLENHRGSRVYDVTAWNLCMAYGLECHWATRAELPPVRPRPPALPDEPALDSGAYGYLIDHASGDVYRAIVRLLAAGVKVRVATEPFSIGGHDYQRGAVLLRRNENPAALVESLRSSTKGLHVEVRSAVSALCDAGPDLGGRRFGLLAPPRVAVASQWPISTTSFGAVWHLLDARLGLRVSPFNVQRLAAMDLRKYNALILPHTSNPKTLAAVMDEGARKKLKKWIEAGGTLIAYGGSAAFCADQEHGLSEVRLRRDVLDQLPVYEEALRREQQARRVEVDPTIVWGAAGAAPDAGAGAGGDTEAGDQPDTAPGNDDDADLEARKRSDAWQRLFSPGGAIVTARPDPHHWLCFGVSQGADGGDRIPVLASGSYALMARHPVQTAVRLGDKETLRLAGLLWPEARQRLADSAYATVERVGFGQIVLFVSDPWFRGYFEGSGRLLLNALIFGPGLGASPTVPW